MGGGDSACVVIVALQWVGYFIKDNILRLCDYLSYRQIPLDHSWNDVMYFVPERGVLSDFGKFFLDRFSTNLRVVCQRGVTPG
jgi:hypothetical protein